MDYRWLQSSACVHVNVSHKNCSDTVLQNFKIKDQGGGSVGRTVIKKLWSFFGPWSRDDTARGSPAEKVEDRGLEPRSGIQDPLILDRFEGGGANLKLVPIFAVTISFQVLDISRF